MPERLTEEQLEKYRSIGQRRIGGPGTSQDVIKDARGSKEVHHWDGRQDAIINAAPIQLGITVKEGKD